MTRAQPPRITVFCSAAGGLEPVIEAEAAMFAKGLAERGWELLYGGGRRGLMGHFADQALAHGGIVRGAITEDLAKGREGAHHGITELLVVKDLFERKRWMLELGDAFVIFPGGFGTLDEALEVITWKALGCHDKPIVFVNVSGFWQHQIETFKKFAQAGMIREGGLELFKVVDDANEAFAFLEMEFEGPREHSRNE